MFISSTQLYRPNKQTLHISNVNQHFFKNRERQKKRHVPYRDSKLKRLLKESLGRNTKTLFIGCVTPAFRFVEETINTLQYAQRAKSIQKEVYENVKQIYNALEKEAQMKEMHEQIETLKELLQKSSHQGESITDVIQEENEPVSSEEINRKSQDMMGSEQFTETRQFTEINVAKTQFMIFQEKVTELRYHYEDSLFRSRELESNLFEYLESRNENEWLVHEIMDTINPAWLLQRDMKFRLDKINMLRTIIKHNDKVIVKLQKELVDNEDMKIKLKNELESLYQVKFIQECQNFQTFSCIFLLKEKKKAFKDN